MHDTYIKFLFQIQIYVIIIIYIFLDTGRRLTTMPLNVLQNLIIQLNYGQVDDQARDRKHISTSKREIST